jgi:hypothetical protein
VLNREEAAPKSQPPKITADTVSDQVLVEANFQALDRGPVNIF